MLMKNSQVTSYNPSAWHGTLPVAFMFSAPGTHEAQRGRPVAGATGTNLSIGLEFLHAARPDLFPSLDRYNYRIANAYAKPLSLALGSGRSEASDREILENGNIDRVITDLNGCNLVVLCGGKARLLSAEIERQLGCRTLTCTHTSTRGISRLPVSTNEAALTGPTKQHPKRGRMFSWANGLLNQLSPGCKTFSCSAKP